MKKTLTIILAFVLVIAMSVAGTVAYLTSTDSATNTFTIGEVKIDLTEPKWDAAGSVDAPEVYPGEPLAKDPTVKNTGKNPCFVRISVTNLDQFGANAPIIYKTDYVANKLGENWVLHTDGYFYYTKPLEVGATTDALFDQIVMPTGIVGTETPKDIVVTAYAVQAQGAKAPNWTAVQGMTVDEIAAWFTTCGM